MNEDYITIIINNYHGKQITYTIPNDGIVEISRSHHVVDGEIGKLTYVNLEIACTDGIEVEEQDIINETGTN